MAVCEWRHRCRGKKTAVTLTALHKHKHTMTPAPTIHCTVKFPTRRAVNVQYLFDISGKLVPRIILPDVKFHVRVHSQLASCLRAEILDKNTNGLQAESALTSTSLHTRQASEAGPHSGIKRRLSPLAIYLHNKRPLPCCIFERAVRHARGRCRHFLPRS